MRIKIIIGLVIIAVIFSVVYLIQSHNQKEAEENYQFHIKLNNSLTNYSDVKDLMDLSDDWILKNCECQLTIQNPDAFPDDCLFYTCGERIKLLNKLNDGLAKQNG